jgi:UDP-GlcNAc:undecaprenyl-phosphate/decaprenyl-phosphate GlcNAc-1-phosphate transferase
MDPHVTHPLLQLQPILKYPFVFLIGFVVCFVFTPLVGRLARCIGMLDMPDARRIHRQPVPRGGGLAVFLGFHAACAGVYLLPWLPFASEISIVWWWRFFALSSLLVVVGFLDDRYGLRPVVKLAGQTLVAVLAFTCDMRVAKILGEELPFAVDLALTLIWFLGIINAYNLIDGLDGLASGLAFIAALGLAGSAVIRHVPGEALVLLGLAGACLAFLRFNFSPASIFLGDTGSMFLGFTLAAIPLSTAAKGAGVTTIVVPLLALGVAILDTTLAIWRRTVRHMLGKETHDPEIERTGHLFQPDLDHVHHRLLRSGLSTRAAATWLYTASLALVAVGLLSMLYRSYAHGIYLIAFVAATYVAVKHLARVELWDSGMVIVQGLRRPPSRVLAVVVYPVLDVIALALALALATWFSTNPQPWDEFKAYWFDQVPLWVGIPFVAMFSVRSYNRVWSRARISEFALLVCALVGGALVAAGLSVFIGSPMSGMDIRVLDFHGPSDTTVVIGQAVAHRLVLQILIFISAATVMLVGPRIFPRLVQDCMTWMRRQRIDRTRSGTALVYGAGNACALYISERALASLRAPEGPVTVGLIDDDRNLHGRLIHGYKVLGGLDELAGIMRKEKVVEIVVTVRLDEAVRTTLLTLTRAAGVRVLEWKTTLVPVA